MSERNPIAAVKAELRSYAQIKAELLNEYGEIDPIALADTLEGETNLHEVLADIALEAISMEAMADAVKSRENALKARRQRIEQTAANLRTVVQQAMEQAGIKTIQQPAVTLTRRPVTPSALIEDEAQIPSDYWKPQPPKLDKAALLAALKDKADVPGARLSNGGETLTIRSA